MLFRSPPDEVSRSKVTEGTAGRVRVPASLVRGPDAAPARTPPPPEAVKTAKPAESVRTDIALPPPSLPEMPAVDGRRLFTEERNLLADARRRRRMKFIAGGIALVGVVCFAVGVWRFSRWPHFDTDPKVAAVNEAVQEYLDQPPASSRPRTTPKPPTASTVPTPPAASSVEPIPPGGAAWLSLDANLPARVYIDGTRIKHLLPLLRYPIKPGVREITVETLGLPRQRESFELRLEKGEHKKLEQIFTPPPQR